MKRGQRKHNLESARANPTPAINDTPRRQFSISNHRDSDTNRPSSSLGHHAPITRKANQNCAIRVINEYLASHSVPFSLKPPLPSAKDITNTIQFLVGRLDWPTENMELDADLPLLLKLLNCPFKFNKSTLKAPGTPHTWPSLLAVIHWLVQVALYNDHLSDDSSSETSATRYFFQDNELLTFSLESYLYYISGNDDEVDALDNKFTDMVKQEKDTLIEQVSIKEKEMRTLEEKLHAMKTAPSAKDILERDKTILEEDVRKFHSIVDKYNSYNVTMRKHVEETETKLEMKKSENQRICEENEELKKALDSQMFNLRDAERMKREVQAMDREISEAKASRNEWEEKSWELDAILGQKLKELENLSIECNHAIRRLKVGDDMQYKLNIKGSNLDEILGNDYKTTLKPALITVAENLKASSMAKLDELITLQRQSQDNQSKIKEKRARLLEIQSQIDSAESHLSLREKELQDYCSMRYTEAKQRTGDFEQEMHELIILERRAGDALKSSRAKLEDIIKQNNHEIQMCASELVMLVDSLSKHKENMESTILEMEKDFSEAAESVTNAYKSSWIPEFSRIA